jgi:hypothetical protein
VIVEQDRELGPGHALSLGRHSLRTLGQFQNQVEELAHRQHNTAESGLRMMAGHEDIKAVRVLLEFSVQFRAPIKTGNGVRMGGLVGHGQTACSRRAVG